MIKAGFAEIDITPPLGTHKVGWLKEMIPTRVADPLFARAAVFETREKQLALVSLDTIFIRAEETAAIREGVHKKHGFPGECVMLHGTHNHGGPPVCEVGDVRRDENYCEQLVEKCIHVIGEAIGKTEDAEIAFGSRALFGVAFNRRLIQRDGIVKTQGTFDEPSALCMEGPIDPEVAVLAVRRPGGDLLGTLVNFGNHPTDHGGDDAFSAGWPGVLVHRMRERGCPQTLFLNASFGNVCVLDPTHSNHAKSMAQTGTELADAVSLILKDLDAKKDAFASDVQLGCRSETIELPYRTVTEDEIRGTVRGAQRFIDPAIYDRNIPRVIEEIRKNNGRAPAEVQVLEFGDHVYATVPCEFFVQLGVRVKEKAYPKHAMIIGAANGTVGYVPHAEAFARGGYETTFLGTSKMGPEAGNLLVDCALRLIHSNG